MSRDMISLLAEHTDAQVSDILNQRGLRTGAGRAFDPITVRWVRSSSEIESLEDRLLAAGWLTTMQIAGRLGVNRSTIGVWRDKGRIEGRICNDRGDWLYSPPPHLVPKGKKPAPHAAPDDEGSSTAGGAV